MRDYGEFISNISSHELECGKEVVYATLDLSGLIGEKKFVIPKQDRRNLRKLEDIADDLGIEMEKHKLGKGSSWETCPERTKENFRRF